MKNKGARFEVVTNDAHSCSSSLSVNHSGNVEQGEGRLLNKKMKKVERSTDMVFLQYVIIDRKTQKFLLELIIIGI
jgi:hypothetical protein